MDKPDRRSRRIRLNTMAGIVSVGLAVFYVLSLGLNPETGDSPSPDTLHSGADRITTELKVTKYNSNGALSHVLTADSAEYFSHYRNKNRDINRDVDNAAITESINQEEVDEFDMEEAYKPEDTVASSELSHTAKPRANTPVGQEAIILQNPYLTILSESQDTIEAQATSGKLLPASRNIELNENVRLADNATQSQLYTHNLTVDTEQKQVFTHDNVRLVGPQAITTATGLIGNMAQKHWQLLGNVQSTLYFE